MWAVMVTKGAAKEIRKLPAIELEKYTLWLNIVRNDGPQGLREIKSFHDEKLHGEWAGHRSSRLSLKWRLIYRVEESTVMAFIEEVTPHKY
ncbi:MAG: type II toxin-antitoxin system mRNA interferase toxin, RelE/StbE family [Polyangiaceae bacterium]